MARLAGQFAGIVLVEAPERLIEDLRDLESQGLRIAVQPGSPGAVVTAAPRLALEMVETTGQGSFATSPRRWRAAA